MVYVSRYIRTNPGGATVPPPTERSIKMLLSDYDFDFMKYKLEETQVVDICDLGNVRIRLLVSEGGDIVNKEVDYI